VHVTTSSWNDAGQEAPLTTELPAVIKSAAIVRIVDELVVVRRWMGTPPRDWQQSATQSSWRSECKLPLVAVLTSIFEPGEAVAALCREGTPLVVVADCKGPPQWPTVCPTVTYVSVEQQERLMADSSHPLAEF